MEADGGVNPPKETHREVLDRFRLLKIDSDPPKIGSDPTTIKSLRFGWWWAPQQGLIN